MNPLAIRGMILLAGATAAFAAGWSVNGWRLGEQIAEMERRHTAATAAANDAHRIKERALSKQLEDARNEATKREAALRRDADTALRAANGMREQLADLRRRMPDLADAAVRRYADAASVVLAECTEEYRAMAEVADRLDSERQTLIEAWPK